MTKYNKNNMLISPIFYMGSKRRLINKGLIDLFPKNIVTFYDVFGGSGTVSMNVKAEHHIVNDADKNLYRLYNLFKYDSANIIINAIYERIKQYGLARERTKRNKYNDKHKIEEYKLAYNRLKNHFNITNDIYDFYTLMFYSFSQQFRFNSKGQFNMPCGNDCFVVKYEEYIRNGCDFFSKAEIHNQDYIDIIKNFNYDSLSTDVFYYFDPPYINTTATYNENNGWTIEDDKILLNHLNNLTRHNIQWALSNVFNNKNITNYNLIQWVIQNNYNIYEFNDFTYTACGQGNSNAKEVLITNYKMSNIVTNKSNKKLF